MSKRVTVRLEGPEAPTARHRRTLASLTEHFQVMDQGYAAIALAGSHSAGGARVVLASDPTVSLEVALDVRVIPFLRFAPRLFAARLQRWAPSTHFALVDSLIKIDLARGDTTHSSLLEQLAAVRAVTGLATRITRLSRAGEGYLAYGESEGHAGVMTFSGVATQAVGPAFTLHAANEDVRLEIDIEDNATARPARVSRFDAEGGSCLPAIHQSSDRLTWLTAFALANGEQTEAYHGSAWQADVQEVQRVLG